jgi:hypothetical protein
MFFNIDIITFNFNVEVGGQAIIPKSFTSRTLELVFSCFIQRTNWIFSSSEFKMS